MTAPCIICVAITGSLPRKEDNPAVPITVAEQVQNTLEAFDLRNIFKAAEMHAADQIGATPYVQFVMGVKNAMPADRDVFDDYIRTVRRLFGEDVPWCAAGIGRHQIQLNRWSIEAGGHARAGLEDNIRIDHDTRAPSNAALVRRAADVYANIYVEAGRPVATAQQARRILGLSANKTEKTA
jgi:uncharacterized protein (DUF849 family)